MTAPTEILALVERFSEHREAYLAGAYNETQLRREFLDPFFEALGWDVSNKQGNAEAYKDVVHEDAINDGWPSRPERQWRLRAISPPLNGLLVSRTPDLMLLSSSFTGCLAKISDLC